MVATFVTYPLDVVHVRYIQQTLKEPKYPQVIEAFRTIVKEEGLNGLYRGIIIDFFGILSVLSLLSTFIHVFYR
jgi:hypothetical protein